MVVDPFGLTSHEPETETTEVTGITFILSFAPDGQKPELGSVLPLATETAKIVLPRPRMAGDATVQSGA